MITPNESADSVTGFFKMVREWLSKARNVVDQAEDKLHDNKLGRLSSDALFIAALVGISQKWNTIIGAMGELVANFIVAGFEVSKWAVRDDVGLDRLSEWEPFRRAEDDPGAMRAAAKIVDYAYFFWWTIVLSIMLVFVSFSLWFVGAVQGAGVLMFLFFVGVVSLWAVRQKLIRFTGKFPFVAGPLGLPVLVSIAGVLLLWGLSLFSPGVCAWMVIFAAILFIASWIILGVTLWPFYKVATAITRKPEAELAEGEEPNRRREGIYGFMWEMVKLITWPFFLLNTTIWLTPWAGTVSVLMFLAFLIVLLALGLAGMSTPFVRKMLNWGTIAMLHVMLLFYAAFMTIPDQVNAMRYHFDNRVMDAVNKVNYMAGGQSPTTKYWDSNRNGIPDQADIDYWSDAYKRMQDGDLSLYPNREPANGDFNGDGNTNTDDLEYFERFRLKNGFPPRNPPNLLSNKQAASTVGGGVTHATTTQADLNSIQPRLISYVNGQPVKRVFNGRLQFRVMSLEIHSDSVLLKFRLWTNIQKFKLMIHSDTYLKTNNGDIISDVSYSSLNVSRSFSAQDIHEITIRFKVPPETVEFHGLTFYLHDAPPTARVYIVEGIDCPQDNNGFQKVTKLKT